MDQITQLLDALIDLLTSDIARVLGVLLVIYIGYQTFETGKIPREKALKQLIGIGIVLGTPAIAQAFGFHP